MGVQIVKKLKGLFIQNPEQEPEQKYKPMELNTIFESDSKDFLKDDILRILCAIIYKTKYAAYFYISISVNKYNIKIKINLNTSGNFILFKIIKKFKLFK